MYLYVDTHKTADGSRRDRGSGVGQRGLDGGVGRAPTLCTCNQFRIAMHNSQAFVSASERLLWLRMSDAGEGRTQRSSVDKRLTTDTHTPRPRSSELTRYPYNLPANTQSLEKTHSHHNNPDLPQNRKAHMPRIPSRLAHDPTPALPPRLRPWPRPRDRFSPSRCR